jgi:hypothetical protein
LRDDGAVAVSVSDCIFCLRCSIELLDHLTKSSQSLKLFPRDRLPGARGLNLLGIVAPPLASLLKPAVVFLFRQDAPTLLALP